MELHIRTSPQCNIMLARVAACIPYVIGVGPVATLTYFDVTFTENHNVYRQLLPLYSIYDFYTSAYCQIRVLRNIRIEAILYGPNIFLYTEVCEGKF